jgi:hypothetical protein
MIAMGGGVPDAPDQRMPAGWCGDGVVLDAIAVTRPT